MPLPPNSRYEPYSALQIGEEHGQIGESKEIGDVVLQRVEDSD